MSLDSPSIIFLDSLIFLFRDSLLPNLLILLDLFNCFPDAFSLANLKKANKDIIAIMLRKIEFNILPTSKFCQ